MAGLFWQSTTSIIHSGSQIRTIAIWSLLSAIFFSNINSVQGQNRTFRSFSTGDTILETRQCHKGPHIPELKWYIECLDGQALIGFRDQQDDFQRVVSVWCKFLFPYKLPAPGFFYPYYPNCHIRNLTTDAFCFDPRNATMTAHSFITAYYDDDVLFRLDRIRQDQTELYKCCRVPYNYYIDYRTCYYKPTHDQYWEYYDAAYFVVYCDTTYVMTGVSRKVNPYDAEYHLDWIQCCRIGLALTNHHLLYTGPVSTANV